MANRSANIDAAILERLDLILRVLALQVGADKSLTERARLLKVAGLDNKTIADVLNTSDATIRTLTSNLRTKPRKK
jgi:DNA-binding NarL/FixJ family response regulator